PAAPMARLRHDAVAGPARPRPLPRLPDRIDAIAGGPALESAGQRPICRSPDRALPCHFSRLKLALTGGEC
ncbi:hypothetical protein, partial [Tahibacter caeni]|uniref:hypothetical protein n=1 Tax=Tahibacter caeni TaxID=1453545 RepID=UPI0021486223